MVLADKTYRLWRFMSLTSETSTAEVEQTHTR